MMNNKELNELTDQLIQAWKYKEDQKVHKLIRRIIRENGKAFTRELLHSLLKTQPYKIGDENE